MNRSLTAAQLADALGYFSNTVISAMHQNTATEACIAQGVDAVACRLAEIAVEDEANAGAGPVGEAAVGFVREAGLRSLAEGNHTRLYPTAQEEYTTPVYARPVDEPGEVERITRERDEAVQNAQDLALDLASAYEKITDAVSREAALAETRAALKAHHDWHLAQEEAPDGVGGAEAYAESPLFSQTVAALTGDAQEASDARPE